ncbi:MAG: xylanase [Chloroflexi bacterium]|nr:xylanase [Chloroflexota bacterium]
MNLLGIDFEDWYHPQLVQPFVKNLKHEPKIFQGLDKIIELLRKTETTATFFMVGELLESHPSMLDTILENGHEISFHTFNHSNLNDLTKEKFLDELDIFKKLTNDKSVGFRAPTFSINHNTSWVIDALITKKYVYDSSIMPTKTQLYGFNNCELGPYKISNSSLTKNDPNGKLLEFPLMIGKFLGKTMPVSGGFYLRFLPLKTSLSSIRNYEKKNLPSTVYVHSWELTPEYLPKLSLPFKEKFVTYHNIQKTYSKLEQILTKFSFSSFEKFIKNNNF